MKIAIPVSRGRVSPVFDAAARLLVVSYRQRRETERREFVLGALSHDCLADELKQMQIDVLLCAAISEPLRLAIKQSGVGVETHLCGEVDRLLAAYLAGDCRRDEFRMPGCWDAHAGRSSQRSRTGTSRLLNLKAKRI